MSAELDGAVVEALTGIRGASQTLINFTRGGAAVPPVTARSVAADLAKVASELEAAAGLGEVTDVADPAETIESGDLELGFDEGLELGFDEGHPGGDAGGDPDGVGLDGDED